MDELDVKRLRLANRELPTPRTQKEGKLPRHAPGEKFLKGPNPWRWIIMSARLPGKALHVGIALFFLGGVTRSRTVKPSNVLLRALGVTRFSKSRALEELEGAGLVSIDRRLGRNPVVTILDPRRGDRKG
jgi:DNA-binding transcriptional ArsR family regulator